VQPRPLIAVGVFAVYAAIVVALWAALDVDYETVADTNRNIVEGIIVPIGAGALFLALVTTWLGWWRPALFEEERAGRRWMLLVPILIATVALISVAFIDWGSPNTDVLALLAVAVLLVGFSEELLTRGLLIVGFRGSMTEGWVWFLSVLLFGLLHSVNVFFGQSLGQTVFQMVFAAMLGTAFYVTRRVLATIVVGMLLHATWDFGVLGADATGGEAYGGILVWPLVVIAFVAVWKLLRGAREPA
jgi:membrane protease YdiL (CAAX protease family)